MGLSVFRGNDDARKRAIWRMFMKTNKNLSPVSFFASLSLMLLSVPAHLMAQKGANTTRVIVPSSAVAPAPNVETINKMQFRSLVPTATVAYKGRTMTKADFIAQRLKEIEALPKISTNTTRQVPAVQLNAEFARQQQTELAARNARVQALFAQEQQKTQALAASPQYAALSKEANDLVNRYQTASPADKAKIKQRARIVHDQLVQMEQSMAASN
jgi:hypothetical protein